MDGEEWNGAERNAIEKEVMVFFLYEWEGMEIGMQWEGMERRGKE